MFLYSKTPRRRNLVVRRAEKVAQYRRRLAAAKAGAPVQYPASLLREGPEDVPVYPGEEVLFSFYRPSLRAGVYTTSVSHTVKAGTETKSLQSSQKFHVVGPRFSLEDGDVVGQYPPVGHSDFSNIVPHVILGDPHLPWMRTGTINNEPGPDVGRNSVPWLALLTFTQDELKVDEAILGTAHEQNATMAVETMSFGDLFALQDTNTVASPYSASDPEEIDRTEKPAFIFIPTDIFKGLFSDYNESGRRIVSDTPDTSRYKYLAHVRKINTEGLPSDLTSEDEQRLFSLVVGHRTPPLDLKETASMSVHLVTIEGVEGVVKLNTAANHIALVSLHSWSYSCLPANMMTLRDRMRHLGDTLDVLRPSVDVIDAIGSSIQDDNLKERVQQRARDGYTAIRYRVQTGEETIAFTRSPFVPEDVPEPLPNLPKQSLSSGTDLQILDKELGIMDLTYCNAWQLGKTLALADRAFTSALVRIRTDAANETVRRAKLEVVKEQGTYFTIEDTLKSLQSILKVMPPLPYTLPSSRTSPENSTRRWQRPKRKMLDLSLKNPDIISRLEKHCTDVVRLLASSTDGEDTPYAEYNDPTSPDWMLIFKWILDRLFLYGIPAHYLVPDPQILPNEALRFFAIDKSWTDALIDGALSVANHQLPVLDKVTRAKIKTQLDDYLNTVDPALGYKPQVPTHGMLLRSEIVSQFPGLMVRAPKPDDYLGAPILRQEVIADGVLLCLFDFPPGTPGYFDTLTIQMPPHQQRFSVAVEGEISPEQITMSFKRVYTDDAAPEASYGSLADVTWNQSDAPTADKPAVFDWDTRSLILPTWNATVMKLLNENMGGHFKDDIATAALAGIQLNDPMYEMTIFGKSAARGALSYNPIAKAFGNQARLLATGGYGPSAASRVSIRALSAVGSDVEPRYKCGIWPVNAYSDKTGDQLNPFPIPNDLGYPIDLVFSILRLPNAASRPLAALRVAVPMGGQNGLMEAYNGPGAYMLSNMRWTMAIPDNSEKERLILTVLPRNELDDGGKGTSPVEYNKELSFVLQGVVPTKLLTSWYIVWTEVYDIDNEQNNPGGFFYYQTVQTKS